MKKNYNLVLTRSTKCIERGGVLLLVIQVAQSVISHRRERMSQTGAGVP